MCPLWPLHYILLYVLALWPIWYAACQLNVHKLKSSQWQMVYDPPVPTVLAGASKKIMFSSFGYTPFADGSISVHSDNPEIASVSSPEVYLKDDNISGYFNITGNFLGYTKVNICIKEKQTLEGTEPVCLKEAPSLPVKVIREKTRLDSVFTVSVIILVSIIFINFGCALDVGMLKEALIKPVGPFIGLICHFCFLPLISYGLGLLLFPNSPTMRLGLFFAGIAPAGGASNIWTFSLGGNLNLSITMTAVSTLFSFVMIPTWVFTLGQEVFSSGALAVPYRKLLTSALGLIAPLLVGYFIQVKYKRLSTLMVRILKPFSAFLIVFIVIFAIVTNLYLFQLFNWEIIVAGLSLPWLGYLAGFLLSSLFRQSVEDITAISIETGVQNTGISIFLLRTCLPQPDADLTTVVPVAVALLTPLPLFLYALLKRCGRSSASSKKLLNSWKDDEEAPNRIYS